MGVDHLLCHAIPSVGTHCNSLPLNGSSGETLKAPSGQESGRWLPNVAQFCCVTAQRRSATARVVSPGLIVPRAGRWLTSRKDSIGVTRGVGAQWGVMGKGKDKYI